MAAALPTSTTHPCVSCGMSDPDCAEKYRTNEDIPCCAWCQHPGAGLDVDPHAVSTTTEDETARLLRSTPRWRRDEDPSPVTQSAVDELNRRLAAFDQDQP